MMRVFEGTTENTKVRVQAHPAKVAAREREQSVLWNKVAINPIMKRLLMASEVPYLTTMIQKTQAAYTAKALETSHGQRMIIGQNSVCLISRGKKSV